MYLAQKHTQGKINFSIRESYFDGSCFRSRTLFDLGTNPEKFIVYPGGNSYYIHETVEEQLEKQGVHHVSDRLEDVFWPFIDLRIRRVVESFSRKRTAGHRKIKNDADPEYTDFHLFDKRRVHYLRFGQMNQGNIGRISPKLMEILRNKSRDEIEQYFVQSEKILRPHELKTYVYVIFNLQRHFSKLSAEIIPQSLNQNELDKLFLKDVCRLNDDIKFWYGTETNISLNEYIIRYVIMYFDNDFGEASFLQDYVKNFMNSRRRFRFPSHVRTIGLDEACIRLGLTKNVLRKMTRRQLTICYRRLALKVHPDKGGNHDKFIQLTEAYQELLKRKSGST